MSSPGETDCGADGGQPAYHRDPFLTTLQTEVTAAGESDGHHWVELADTVFYPEGGGQPADRGTIDGIPVIDVQKVGGAIRHSLSRPAPAATVRLELDWARRWDHMQQHTAQHVLTAVALRELGWRTTAFHLGAEVSDIELDVAKLERRDLEWLEGLVDEHIRAARPISSRTAKVADFERLGVRSRRLPEGFSGPVRLVDIEGLDLNTCGGTHLRSTAEIGCLCLLGAEPMRGGSRLFFVAGTRVRRRMRSHELRNAELRSLLDTGDDELADVVALRVAREKELARSVRRLSDELADSAAAEIASSGGDLVERHWEDRDMGFLQRVARSLVSRSPRVRALLTASSGGAHLFVLAASDEAGIDLAVVGPRVAELFGGRGGGRGEIFQGKGASLAKRDEALKLVRDG